MKEKEKFFGREWSKLKHFRIHFLFYDMTRAQHSVAIWVSNVNIIGETRVKRETQIIVMVKLFC